MQRGCEQKVKGQECVDRT